MMKFARRAALALSFLMPTALQAQETIVGVWRVIAIANGVAN